MQERVKAIVEGDMIFRLFDMELVEAGEGFASVRAEVKKSFLNAHNIAHGSLIFALLDVAFAIAANSLTDAVGIQWSINMVKSALAGDHVKAEAKLIHRGKHSLVFELKAESETTNKLLAQGIATALPFPRERIGAAPIQAENH